MNKTFFRILLLSAAATGLAHAGDVDFGGAGCGDPLVTTYVFPIVVDSGGILCDTFTFDMPDGGNVTGITITGDLSASRNPTDYTCITSVFLRCDITVDDPDNLLVFTLGGTNADFPGIGPRGTEQLSMRGFAPNQTFTGEASPTPEPGTVALILGGLLVLALVLARRKPTRCALTAAGNAPPH